MNSVLWIGSRQDHPYFLRLKEKLNALGVILNEPDDFVQIGEELEKQINGAICASELVVLFITEQSLKSKYCMREFEFSILQADNRAKVIIPIVQWGQATFEKSNDIAAKSLQFLLCDIQWITPVDGLHSEKDYNQVANIIDNLVSSKRTKEELYEKIAGFTKIKYHEGIVLNSAKIIQLLDNDININGIQNNKIDIYIEMVRLLQLMSKWSFWGDDAESRDIANECITSIQIIQRILGSNELNETDLLLASIGKCLVSYMMDVWIDAIEILSNDDIHSPGSENLKKYTELYNTYNGNFQRIFMDCTTSELINTYSPSEIQVIQSANTCTLNQWIGEKKEARPKEPANSQLAEIADYLQKANSLFNSIENVAEPVTFLRCLKTSYERLQQYCEIVTCIKIGAICVEKIAEINHRLEMLSDATEELGMEETAFKALLGLKTHVDDKYDVFISYKHEDLDIAYNIYHYLISNLLHPFFDKVSLPEVARSEYEDAIMNALENSSHFLVILTSLEQLESYWVKLEMSTFHHEMAEGRKDHANFILLVTDEVYEKIIASNKKCLNIRYRLYEVMRISQYKNMILSYLTE